jgi:hypothetical protein
LYKLPMQGPALPISGKKHHDIVKGASSPLMSAYHKVHVCLTGHGPKTVEVGARQHQRLLGQQLVEFPAARMVPDGCSRSLVEPNRIAREPGFREGHELRSACRRLGDQIFGAFEAGVQVEENGRVLNHGDAQVGSHECSRDTRFR